MKKDKYIVYMHTCPNSKRYIGITKLSPNARWKNGLGYKSQSNFYADIVKFGWNNIKHEIIDENLNHDMACEEEIYLIGLLKTNNPKYGYNQTSGGDGTCNYSHKNPHDEEWRKKVSLANTGKKRTDEAKQKMREAKLGTHWSDERRKQYSDNQKKRGFKPSDACHKASSERRRIEIDVFEGEKFIGTFRTISEAANSINVSVSYISICLSGKIKNPKYTFIRRNKK